MRPVMAVKLPDNLTRVKEHLKMVGLLTFTDMLETRLHARRTIHFRSGGLVNLKLNI
mgnify:CR=1 FL=1